jgi:hypothetical protein
MPGLTVMITGTPKISLIRTIGFRFVPTVMTGFRSRLWPDADIGGVPEKKGGHGVYPEPDLGLHVFTNQIRN